MGRIVSMRVERYGRSVVITTSNGTSLLLGLGLARALGTALVNVVDAGPDLLDQLVSAHFDDEAPG